MKLWLHRERIRRRARCRNWRKWWQRSCRGPSRTRACRARPSGWQIACSDRWQCIRPGARKIAGSDRWQCIRPRTQKIARPNGWRVIRTDDRWLRGRLWLGIQIEVERLINHRALTIRFPPCGASLGSHHARACEAQVVPPRGHCCQFPTPTTPAHRIQQPLQ